MTPSPTAVDICSGEPERVSPAAKDAGHCGFHHLMRRRGTRYLLHSLLCKIYLG